MPLYLADVHLHRARLFRDRPALAKARALIDHHGYAADATSSPTPRPPPGWHW